MNRRRTFAPEIEVSGGNILSLLAALGSFRSMGEELLAEQGVSGVVAQGWYPLQGFLAALESISRKSAPTLSSRSGGGSPTTSSCRPS
ncbi:MAG: hypothetical protein M3434_11055 [Gemmatimonadota bacterium]|nr:hypothetical protein [Gemmatimonadota bacterium]